MAGPLQGLDRNLDQSFALISAMATSNARWRRFAHTGKGASRMIFPAALRTDSRPSTLRSSSSEMRLVPIETYFFAQAYRRMAYLLRSLIAAFNLIPAEGIFV